MLTLLKKIIYITIGITLTIYYFLGNKIYKWEKIAKNNLKRKRYKSYSHYLKHQKSKLGKVQKVFLPEYDIKFRKELFKRLIKSNLIKKDMSVLCLAARIGTEVKAFIDLGCFAIGVDLNPGKDNKHVVYGDFHNLQFADSSVDIIYSNSVDHVYDLKKFITEMKRVLNPSGLLILEICFGENENFKPGLYEVLSWKKTSDLVEIFLTNGFKEIYKTEFTYPWPGVHICMRIK